VESSRTRRPVAALTVLCSAALLGTLAWPLLTRQVFVFNDLSWFHLPLRYLYQQALQGGDTVLWTPSIFAGFYVHGEGQLGAFHPLHQLLYRFLPLDIAFNLELLASYVAGYAGMVWFLRRLELRLGAALVGAMLFAFSGFALLHHHHLNVIAIVAHLPWLLAGADAVIVEERGKWRQLGFATLACGIGSAFLLGFPQAVWWDALALSAFAIYRAAESRRWRGLLACTAAVVIGVLIGGVQLLPSADAVAHSVRADVPRDFAMTFSLHPANLLQLWSPRVFARGAYSEDETMLFHELGIYSGAILPVALCWMWSRRRALPAPRRGLIAAATALVMLGVWLALGRFGGLAGLLAHLPVLQSLRAPARYIVLAQFAAAVLAALTIDDLLAIREGEADVRPSIAVWIPLALSVATLLTINTGLLSAERYSFAGVAAVAPGVALMAAVSLFVVLAARRVRWALPALVLVTMVDLAVWGVPFVYAQLPRPIAAIAYRAPAAPPEIEESYAAAPDDGGPYRSNQLVLRGYRLTTGYVGLYPAMRHPFDGKEAMELSGTRWRFTIEGLRTHFVGGVDRVRLVDREQNSASGTVRMAIDRPGRLVAHVEASGPRILAFTERFHSGWSATIDGRQLQMVRVDGDFLGCLLDAGVHRVELRFMPRSFVYGSIVSACGIVALGITLVTSRARPLPGTRRVPAPIACLPK
jgi:hypothetical protein